MSVRLEERRTSALQEIKKNTDTFPTESREQVSTADYVSIRSVNPRKRVLHCTHCSPLKQKANKFGLSRVRLLRTLKSWIRPGTALQQGFITCNPQIKHNPSCLHRQKLVFVTEH